MKEELLQYLWKNSIFNHDNLRTTDGREIHVINPGLMHQDAGPDFKGAVIRIDDMIWAGDVEVHVNGSDWYRHHHQRDDKYLSVILHVVYTADMEIVRKDCEMIPTLELKDYIPADMLEEYQRLTLSENSIPCGNSIVEVPHLALTSIISSLAVERLLRRQKQMFRILEKCEGDWDELTYRILAINFGFNVNGTAFELLAQSLPYKIISRHERSRLQIYALVFGQAGMLDNPEISEKDSYLEQLKNEYDYLRYKYRLSPIDPKVWNLLRLRPTNFPCVRLAQFSELLFCLPNIFQELIIKLKTDNIRCLLGSISPDEYWKTHFHFGRKTKEHPCHIGKSALNLLIINTMAPVLFAYGSFAGNDKYKSRALNMLEINPPEDNIVTRQFGRFKFPMDSAMVSQALLELYSVFCKHKKCYSCPIGQYIVTKLYKKDKNVSNEY